MRNADGFRPLSSVFDEWAAICISFAAVVYILRALPPLLAPSGLLGSLGCFILGLALGLSAAVALLVLLFLWLTEPDRHKQHSREQQAAGDTAAKWTAQQHLKGGFKAIPTECPLPSIRRRGHFKDCIFTVPGTQWDPTSAVDEWPPAHEGPKALVSKWHAKLKPGLLVLKPDGTHPKANASAVRISLVDCEVRVVTEGLRNKTRWWKKVPLELKHPSRTLLHSEKSVYLFAANGYAKEQLYLALQHSIQEGAPFLGVGRLYAAFCHSTKALEVVPFPRAKEIIEDMESALQAASDPLPNNSKKRPWFRFGRGRASQKSLAASTNSLRVSQSGMSMASSMAAQEAVLAEEPSSRKGMGTRSPSPTKLPNGVSFAGREEGVTGPLPAMDPEELEKRWEGQYRYKNVDVSFSQMDGGPISLQASTTTTDLEASYALLQTQTLDNVGQRRSKRHTMSAVDTINFGGSREALDVKASYDDSDLNVRFGAPGISTTDPLPLPLSPTRDPISPPKDSPVFSPHSTPLTFMHASASMPELAHIHFPLEDPLPTTTNGSPFRTTCSESGAVPGGRRSEDGARSPEPADRQQSRPDNQPPPSPAPSSQGPTPAPSASIPPSTPGQSTHNETGAQKVAVEGVHGLNMMLNRLWFELLRSRNFEEAARNLVQRKLDDIKRPPYLHRLQVTSVDLGTTGPYVKHIAALPCPNSNIVWPQVMMEICYSGSVSLVIGTKVELSKSKTWRGLERTIESIRGGEGVTTGELRSDGSLADQDIDEMTEALNAIPTDGLQEPAGGSMREQGQSDQSVKNGRRRWMGMLPGIRRVVADGIRNAVGAVSDSLAKIPFQIHVKLTKLDGTLLLWVPPPPSDRLWISFINTPKLDLTCKPSLGNRVLQSTTFLTRASSWLHGKLMRALTKSCVFPACNDFKLPWFSDLEGLVEARGLQLPNMMQNQSQEWETASSGESEGEEEQGSWRADNDIPVVSHPVTDLLDGDRAVHPKDQPNHTNPLVEPEPILDSVTALSSASTIDSRSLRAATLSTSMALVTSEAEARKQKKKEAKGAKEAKKREAKEQRQEAKQRAKRDKMLARELSATTISSTASTVSQALTTTSSQGVRAAVLKRPWLFKKSNATSSLRVGGLLRSAQAGEEVTERFPDLDMEPRTQSMTARGSGECMLVEDTTDLRRSNSMSDLVELKRRSVRMLARSGSRKTGYNSDTTLDDAEAVGSEAVCFASSSYTSIAITQAGLFNNMCTPFEARRASCLSLASTPTISQNPTPKGPSDTSVPELIYSDSPDLGLRVSSGVQLPLPPTDLSSSPHKDPLGGIPVNPLSASCKPDDASPEVPATPPDQAPLPFITPPSSAELHPSILSGSHSAPTLVTMVGSPTESVYATPTTINPCPIPDMDSDSTPNVSFSSPFATYEAPVTSVSTATTQQQANSATQRGAGSTPPITKSNSRGWLGSAMQSYQIASTLEASTPGIRRQDHSYSTGSLMTLGGASSGHMDASNGAITTVAGGQVVNRLKNMFGEVMARRNEASSEGGGSSRRSGDTDISPLQSTNSASLPQSGGSRFSNALTKMSSVASAAKAEVGKKLVQSAMARLRDATHADASPRHLTYSDPPR